MSKVHRIGYIGLGNAGYPLAGLLPKNGYTVVVRDADAARAEEFAAEHEGAKVAVEGSKGFSDVDILVTMLPNGDVVRQVLLGGDGVEGVASGLKDGEVLSSSLPTIHTHHPEPSHGVRIGWKEEKTPLDVP